MSEDPAASRTARRCLISDEIDYTCDVRQLNSLRRQSSAALQEWYRKRGRGRRVSILLICFACACEHRNSSTLPLWTIERVRVALSDRLQVRCCASDTQAAQPTTAARLGAARRSLRRDIPCSAAAQSKRLSCCSGRPGGWSCEGLHHVYGRRHQTQSQVLSATRRARGRKRPTLQRWGFKFWQLISNTKFSYLGVDDRLAEVENVDKLAP